MASVADRLRQADREALRALTPAERMARALALGERDLEVFRSAHRLTPEEARRALERRRQAGRRSSRCAAALAG